MKKALIMLALFGCSQAQTSFKVNDVILCPEDEGSKMMTKVQVVGVTETKYTLRLDLGMFVRDFEFDKKQVDTNCKLFKE